MAKRKRFRKVVEWKEHNTDDGEMLFTTFIFMIPFINIIAWLIMLFWSIKDREVYYEEIRK